MGLDSNYWGKLRVKIYLYFIFNSLDALLCIYKKSYNKISPEKNLLNTKNASLSQFNNIIGKNPGLARKNPLVILKNKIKP